MEKKVQLMTINQFCEAVGITRMTCYKMINNGTLTVYNAPDRNVRNPLKTKVQKKKLINPNEVLQLVELNKIKI